MRMRRHLIELILFSTYAELRAERARSYLGLIWWVADPLMQFAVWWLLIDVILHAGGKDYLPSLLIGVTLWQWMKSCMIHGGYAIGAAVAVMALVAFAIARGHKGLSICLTMSALGLVSGSMLGFAATFVLTHRALPGLMAAQMAVGAFFMGVRSAASCGG